MAAQRRRRPGRIRRRYTHHPSDSRPTLVLAAVRLAVLYDVRGNLQALEAVLAEAGAAGCHGFLHGGDAALFGLEPAACVDRLRGLPNARHIRGNTDRYLADETRPAHADWERDTLAW